MIYNWIQFNEELGGDINVLKKYYSINRGGFDPNSKKDFSKSVIKDVVWRAGKIEENSASGGIWFGISKSDVEKFAKSTRRENRVGIPYYINITNPKYYDSFWYDYLEDVGYSRMGRELLRDKLEKEGYDGIIIGEDVWNDTNDENSITSKQYVVFDPSNVKIAKEK